MNVLDLTVAEAKTGTAGVDCTPPKTTATTTDKTADPVAAAAKAPLACTKRRLVLTDVVRVGNRVTIFGVADRRLVGKTVAIKFEADGKVAGTAKVAKKRDLQDDHGPPGRAPARLQPRPLPGGPRQGEVAEPQAGAAHVRRPAELRRRQGDRQGPPDRAVRRATPQTITLTRRVSCKKSAVVARFKPKADGTFSVTVPAPTDQAAAVYRLGTKVQKSATNKKLFPTFTLPQGVSLTQ